MKLIHLAKILIASSIAFSVAVGAHNKVVVIPLGDAEAASLKNVITVSAENGDFTNVADAMASITDATPVNPYMIFIGPGIYTLADTLEVKNHVHIRGSGKDLTFLVGDQSSAADGESSALMIMLSDTSIAHLDIVNAGVTGPTDFRTALYVSGSARIEDLQVNADSMSSGQTYGILSHSFGVEISNTYVALQSDGVVGDSFGIYARFGLTKLTNVRFFSSFELSLGDSPVGAFFATNLEMSTGSGNTLSINNDNSKIIQSIITSGTVLDNSASKNCVDLINNSLNFLTC